MPGMCKNMAVDVGVGRDDSDESRHLSDYLMMFRKESHGGDHDPLSEGKCCNWVQRVMDLCEAVHVNTNDLMETTH